MSSIWPKDFYIKSTDEHCSATFAQVLDAVNNASLGELKRVHLDQFLFQLAAKSGSLIKN